MNAIAFEINGRGTVFILYTQTLMNKIPFFSEESIPFYAAKNLRRRRHFVPKICKYCYKKVLKASGRC